MSMANSRDEPLPLGRVVAAVKDWVGRLGEVWVSAQIVELKRRNAPTQFLTLRDLTGQFSCQATSSAYVLDLAGPLPEGASIVARLKPRVFERSAALTFEVLELHVAGEGRLLMELEQLKRKLQAEGLFDVSLKRALPVLPNQIGLITGRSSDAERDVLRNVELRWPAAQFRVEHALMQGREAAASVMRALAELDADPDVDVIVIARGGGSLEDLLPFSDEGLVRAVVAAGTPVVSAIGHERDTPILDLVADLRASTPTDAAKRIVPDAAAELASLATARARLRGAFQAKVAQEERWLAELRSRPVLLDPTRAFAAHRERVALLTVRLRAAIGRLLNAESAEVIRLLTAARALSPKGTLERGYAVLVGDDGAVSSVAAARPGDRISAHLADGQLTLDVVAAQERNRNG